MKVSKGQLRNGHIIVFENKLSGLTLLYLTFDNARSVWLSRLYIRYRTRGGQNSEKGSKTQKTVCENCIMSGSPLCRGAYTLCIEHPRPTASQSGIEPGTSCTAGELSMQRTIRTALLIKIWNLSLYYYRTKFNFCFWKIWKVNKMSSLYCTCTCMWHCISI